MAKKNAVEADAPLSDEQKSEIRGNLDEQFQQIQNDLSTAIEDMKEASCNSPDQVDKADSQAQAMHNLNLCGRQKKLLNKTIGALKRLDADSFGICSNCGCNIPFERLLLRPTAEECIDCKQLSEQQEKQQRS